MSDPWAISAVTQTLSQLLRGIPTEEPTLGPLNVSAEPPDRARMGPNAGSRQLNLFLYRVAPNPGWANEDLPFRSSDGALTRRPVLALDLCYLLTAYGFQDSQVDAQHVLAHGMSLLHDRGVFGQTEVRAALNAAGTPLSTADLDKQVDRVKVAPQMLTDEDLFRMWTVFGTAYRLSVGYNASVVLIERRQPARRPLPVRDAALTVVPLHVPIIEDVEPRPAKAGDTLILTGLNLSADRVTVRFGDIDVVPPAAKVGPGRLEVALPAALRAGPNTLQVLQDIELPGGSGTRPFFSSDVTAFVLAPKITTAIPAGGLPVARGAALALGVDPPVRRDQRVTLLLGDRAVSRTVSPTDPEMLSTVSFAIPAGPDFPAGTVLLRVVVDGAESTLQTDSSGQYTGPKAVVS
jgi:hypothetical protein